MASARAFCARILRRASASAWAVDCALAPPWWAQLPAMQSFERSINRRHVYTNQTGYLAYLASVASCSMMRCPSVSYFCLLSQHQSGSGSDHLQSEREREIYQAPACIYMSIAGMHIQTRHHLHVPVVSPALRRPGESAAAPAHFDGKFIGFSNKFIVWITKCRI